MFGLGFLNSIFLLGLVAIAAPIIIHLLNRRRVRKIRFSSLEFLSELTRRRMRKVNLRRILILILRTLAVLLDVTERKRLEDELQQMREELEGKAEQQMALGNPYHLTFREFTVLYHVADGEADKEMAAKLGISPLTVHKHVSNILHKMNASSRTEAGTRAVREGLLN